MNSLPKIQIGVLHSLTGRMALNESHLVDAVQLAVEEINQAGGVLGHCVEAIVEDGASDPDRFAAKAEKLLAEEQEKQTREQSETRRSLVGSGDRSERIRTYNFPQGRLTDHRINLTLYKLDEILEGNLDQVIEPLINEHQADLLAALAD